MHHHTRHTDWTGDTSAMDIVTYQSDRQIGGSFDKDTGIFTAPRYGKYKFYFQTLSVSQILAQSSEFNGCFEVM